MTGCRQRGPDTSEGSSSISPSCLLLRRWRPFSISWNVWADRIHRLGGDDLLLAGVGRGLLFPFAALVLAGLRWAVRAVLPRGFAVSGDVLEQGAQLRAQEVAGDDVAQRD